MYCNKCGAVNNDDSTFCSKCGAQLIIIPDTPGSSNSDAQGTTNVYNIVQSDSKIYCPYCKSSNVRREKRDGCMDYIGTLILMAVAIAVCTYFGCNDAKGMIEWLVPVVGIGYLIYIIYQKSKPKWEWRMYCEDCTRYFEYDSATKKSMKIKFEEIDKKIDEKLDK